MNNIQPKFSNMSQIKAYCRMPRLYKYGIENMTVLLSPELSLILGLSEEPCTSKKGACSFVRATKRGMRE